MTTNKGRNNGSLANGSGRNGANSNGANSNGNGSNGNGAGGNNRNGFDNYGLDLTVVDQWLDAASVGPQRKSVTNAAVEAPHTMERGETVSPASTDGSTNVSSVAAIEAAARLILTSVGEDPEREGLVKTPQRVAKMYGELLEGYRQDLTTVVNGAMFDVEYGSDEMVVVADIPYQSMCEHHMLPFVGRAHVAYIPKNQVIGLSKIPRIVDMFAKRLQIQERLGNEVADALVEAMDPEGVIVMIEGQHSCASLRGVKKHGVNMVTTARRGAFRFDAQLRDEFFRMIGR